MKTHFLKTGQIKNILTVVVPRKDFRMKLVNVMTINTMNVTLKK